MALTIRDRERKESIANTLRAQGVILTEIAKILGVSASTVSRWTYHKWVEQYLPALQVHFGDHMVIGQDTYRILSDQDDKVNSERRFHLWNETTMGPKHILVMIIRHDAYISIMREGWKV